MLSASPSTTRDFTPAPPPSAYVVRTTTEYRAAGHKPQIVRERVVDGGPFLQYDMPSGSRPRLKHRVCIFTDRDQRGRFVVRLTCACEGSASGHNPWCKHRYSLQQDLNQFHLSEVVL